MSNSNSAQHTPGEWSVEEPVPGSFSIVELDDTGARLLVAARQTRADAHEVVRIHNERLAAIAKAGAQ